MGSTGTPGIPDTPAGGRAAPAGGRGSRSAAPEAGQHHEPGQHTLGPHVVGQRVVVRRLVPGETGPTGGPAFTDVLGTCLSWADGWCVVQPDTGAPGAEPVRIATADVVSGKPVPPRPSVRHRVDPATAQRHAMALFADLHTEPLGGWVLRHSPTSTARRANSVLAFGEPGITDPVERVTAFYAGTTGRPIAAVLPGSPEERLFLDRGWLPESTDADTVFALTGVARALRTARSLAGQHPTPPVVEEGRQARLETPAATPPTQARATITDHTTRLATGLAAFASDWLGVRAVEVAAPHRRRGLALAVMAALLEWGAEQGASTAYLQVIADNQPALTLYDRLGFTEHHRYRYLAAPR